MAFNEITGQALRDFDASRKIGMPTATKPARPFGAPAAPQARGNNPGYGLQGMRDGNFFTDPSRVNDPTLAGRVAANPRIGVYEAGQPANWHGTDQPNYNAIGVQRDRENAMTQGHLGLGAARPGRSLAEIPNGPGASATSPTANPKGTLDALLADLIAEHKATRDAMQGRINQNDTLRKETIGALDAYENPWQDPAKLAKQQRTDANEAFLAWNGTQGNMRRAGGGRRIGGTATDLEHESENYRAAVDIANARREDDFTQRADAVNQWKIGMREQLIGADLAGNQIGQLSGMANQGFQTASQGLLMPQQMDQTRAVIEGLKSQNKMTAAQASQAEWIAQNQGSLALINFLSSLAGGAGRVIGMM